jgi:hypothetical protein
MTIHPAPPRRRWPNARLRLLFSASLLVAVLAVAALGSWPPPPAAATAAERPDHPAARAAVAPAVGADTPAAQSPPPERIAAVDAPGMPLPSFEELVEQLVTIGRQTAASAQADDIEAAQASDQEARRLFGALLQRFHDAGERALAVLAALPEPTVDESDHSRRVVLQLVLAAELERRHELAVANQDHSRIDPLVAAVLGVMPQATGTTEVGSRLLDNAPYLRSTHEPAVLHLVQLAAEGSFSRAVATRLLATLWDNLQRTGERSSDELSRLAMLLLADDDPTKRVVACRQLIADPRFRGMALAWVREHGDAAIATDLAGQAARELDPGDALQVLRELAPLLQRATGIYMVLGSRAPELLGDAYRDYLAANTHPDLRAELVTGVGHTGAQSGREVAELALHNDPAPAVRVQAAFVITANGDADAGERALQLLLDDPVIARDPTWLGAVVLALHNLEAGAATNHIDRLGQRLRTLPLSVASRQSLEALLARCLPGGQVSSPGSGPDGSVPSGSGAGGSGAGVPAANGPGGANGMPR